jgi:hypothetical protein
MEKLSASSKESSTLATRRKAVFTHHAKSLEGEAPAEPKNGSEWRIANGELLEWLPATTEVNDDVGLEAK